MRVGTNLPTARHYVCCAVGEVVLRGHLVTRGVVIILHHHVCVLLPMTGVVPGNCFGYFVQWMGSLYVDSRDAKTLGSSPAFE